MEVVVPHHLHQELPFHSSPSTPFVTPPSSPPHYAFFLPHKSAPSSPSSSSIPFLWESKPGTPKSPRHPLIADDDEDDDDDFAFDFSGHLDASAPLPTLSSADELFESGKIRPLKPPPRLLHPPTSPPVSPRSKTRRNTKSAAADAFDPFEAAIHAATADRGRQRSHLSPSISSSRSRKGSRSLSPLRTHPSPVSSSPAAAAASSATSAGAGTLAKSVGSKKWRLRDLLLFRSASEGRATGNRSKDPLRKYSLLPSSHPSSSLASSAGSNRRGLGGEDSKNSSFRSTDSGDSVRRSSRTALSAHEKHYTANRAAAEEMKKKTALPYRQGLFAFLRYNPAVNSISRGFNNRSFNNQRS